MDNRTNEKIKEICINVLRYVLIFIILICVYMSSLILTSLIPSKYMKENVRVSSEKLFSEGEKVNINLGYKEENIFTFTDALMINTAYSVDSSTPLKSAMLARKNYIPGQTSTEHIDNQYNLGASEQYVNKKNGDIYQTAELYGLMHGENITESFEYARYWHGYLTVLRPLLVVFSYQAIRVILSIVTTILLATLSWKLYKKIGLTTAIIFLLGFMSVNIFIVTKSMNEIIVFLIAIIFGIYLLSKKEYSKNIGVIFFVIGSVTNFFDLLTAPLITLAIPTIIYILIQQKNKENLKGNMIALIKICILWAIGYGATWLVKWIIVQVLYNRPIITIAIEQALFRTNGGKVQNINYKNTVKKNIEGFSRTVIKFFTGLIVIYILVKLFIIVKKNKKITLLKNIKQSIPYIFIGILPFAWYFILKQHSTIHSFFTYRILCITIISILTIVNKLLQTQDDFGDGLKNHR